MWIIEQVGNPQNLTRILTRNDFYQKEDPTKL